MIYQIFSKLRFFSYLTYIRLRLLQTFSTIHDYDSLKNISFFRNGPSPTLLDLSTPKEIKPVNPVPPAQPVSQSTEISPLTGFSFSISEFTPSNTCRTLVDENGIRVILVRGTNKIPDRDDVSVLLVTFDSTNPKPVENLIFNAKVLKPYRKV